MAFPLRTLSPSTVTLTLQALAYMSANAIVICYWKGPGPLVERRSPAPDSPRWSPKIVNGYSKYAGDCFSFALAAKSCSIQIVVFVFSR